MISVLFLMLSCVLGCSLLRKTSLKLYIFEWVSAGFVLGSFILVWSIFLLALILGLNQALMSAFLLASIIIFITSIGKKQSLVLPHVSLGNISLYIIYTLTWSALLLSLFSSHMLERKSDGLYSGGGAWGDIALHSTFVQKFASNNRINLTSPIYAQEKTTYPFLIDFFAALLVRTGMNLQASLMVTGFLYTLSFLQLTYFFILRTLKSHASAWLFSILFFFNGGIGAWYAYKDFMVSKVSAWRFLFTMQVEYAHLAIYNLHWSNIIADYILPQRAFLAGLPIFILSLILMRSLWYAHEDHAGQRFLLVSIIGMLPLFHTHTFLALFGLLACFSIFESQHHQRSFVRWIAPIGLLLLLCTPQLIWQFSQTFNNGFMRLQFGWMKGDENIFIFWLRNMGLEALFFLAGGAVFLLGGKHQTFLKALFLPLSFLFLLTNVIVFQPHDYDNMKLMIYAHFAIILVTTLLLQKIWKKHIIGKIIVILCCVLLTLTGALSVLRESYTSWQIATIPDIQIAQAIQAKTSPDAIFLTADSHNHPVTMLGGRSIVMGYRGWLWTHGINYTATEKDVMAMFAGTSQTPFLLRQYHVSYVYIGDAEKTTFYANQSYFDAHYDVIFQNESGTIYDVTSHAPTFAIKNI